MTVFITAPHAGCFKNLPQRHCDRLAEEAALSLRSLLPNSEIFIGRVFRGDLDLNRDESLDHPFRVEIRELAEELQPTILLDVHSFPEKDTNFGDIDIAILDEKPGTDYGHDLHRYLRDNTTYRISYFSGINNSIMEEMREMGTPAILIEYRESMTDNDLATINNIIVDWLFERGYLE